MLLLLFCLGQKGDAVIETIRAGYDRWSAIYDHDANPLPPLEEPVVWSALGKVRGMNVLDLGCGTGRHSFWLASQGATVTALDFSPGMLEQAQRKSEAEKIKFMVHDLHQPLPLASEMFDVVVSGLVLEHLQKLDSFFEEVLRVLKRGGRTVLSTLHPSMFLRGSQARFTDPASGEVIQPGSVQHSISDFIMAGLRAGSKSPEMNQFRLSMIGEHAPDAIFAKQFPRAEKYVNWPMLVVMQFQKE